MTISRKQFLRNAALLTTSFGFPGMISSCLRSDDKPDIALSSDFENLSKTVKSQYNRIYDMAKNTEKSLRIGLDDNEVVQMSVVENDASSYRHVRLRKESDGDVANLLIGRDDTYPVIKLTDDNGNVLSKNGQELSFSFQDFGTEADDSDNWFELGIKVTAIAFALWIGLSIAKGIFAALAFLAFNAMVLGLVIASISFLAWFIETAGWNIEYIKEVFNRTADRIEQLFYEIVEVINNF